MSIPSGSILLANINGVKIYESINANVTTQLFGVSSNTGNTNIATLYHTAGISNPIIVGSDLLFQEQGTYSNGYTTTEFSTNGKGPATTILTADNTASLGEINLASHVLFYTEANGVSELWGSSGGGQAQVLVDQSGAIGAFKAAGSEENFSVLETVYTPTGVVSTTTNYVTNGSSSGTHIVGQPNVTTTHLW